MKTISKFLLTVLALVAITCTSTAQVRNIEVLSLPAIAKNTSTNLPAPTVEFFITTAAQRLGIIDVRNATSFTLWATGTNTAGAITNAFTLQLVPGISPTTFITTNNATAGANGVLTKTIKLSLNASNDLNYGAFAVATNLSSGGFPYWKIISLTTSDHAGTLSLNPTRIGYITQDP